MAEPFNICALTLRAMLRAACRLRGRDPICLELRTPLLREPVVGPWGAGLTLEFELLDPSLPQCLFYFKVDNAGRRAARISWCDRDFERVSTPCHIANDAEIDEADCRDFGIRHIIKPVQNVLRFRF